MSTGEGILSGIKALAVWMLSTAIKAETTEPLDVEGRFGLVLPKDREWKDITDDVAKREQALYDLAEKRSNGPRRIRGVEVAQTLEGFCALVNRHKGATTKIDAELTEKGKPRFVAKIDYHGASDGSTGPDPRWCEHWVIYEFPFSRPFLQWSGAGVFVDKKAFLDWADRNYVDIAYPGDVPRNETDGSYGTVTDYYFRKVMIAKAGFTDEQRKAADLSSVFGTALDLLKGVRGLSSATNESLEETKDEDGSMSVQWKRSDKLVDPVKVKRYYLVDLRVFEGDTESRTIPCEFVTRTEGGLSMKIDLLGVEKIIEAAFEDARKSVEKETGLLPMRVEAKVRQLA